VYSKIFLIMARFTNGEDDVYDIIDQAPQVLIASLVKGLLSVAPSVLIASLV